MNRLIAILLAIVVALVNTSDVQAGPSSTHEKQVRRQRAAWCPVYIRDRTLFVQGGTFELGETNSVLNPRRRVTLASFCIDAEEMTLERYLPPCPTCDWPIVPRGPLAIVQDFPATGVNCDDASAACAAEGKRLPTQDEWELAATGGTPNRFPEDNFGNLLPESEATIHFQHMAFHVVGGDSKDYSHLRVRDMAGNVSEWTSSVPLGQPNDRLTRGGSFRHSSPSFLMVSATPSSTQRDDIGFRCVRSLPPTLSP